MIKLPMTAFLLRGDGNDHIGLQITEVYGFPNEIAYGGGYGAQGILDIHSGPYKVYANHYFTTGELYKFYCQLQNNYNNIYGESILQNSDKKLQLKLSIVKTGKVIAIGEFQAYPDSISKLCFEIHSDQTEIAAMLHDLNHVHQIFGDMKGITNKM